MRVIHFLLKVYRNDKKKKTVGVFHLYLKVDSKEMADNEGRDE